MLAEKAPRPEHQKLDHEALQEAENVFRHYITNHAAED